MDEEDKMLLANLAPHIRKGVIEFLKLHPELRVKDIVHFVRRPRKDGRPGYARRIPKTYKNKRARSVGQLRSQLTWSKTAHDSYGKKGFREGLPIVAAEIKAKMKGRRFRRPKWEEVVAQLTESLREVGVVLEEKAIAREK